MTKLIVDKDRLPVHVAIIPDGNRRWAKKHHLPVFEGHRRGYNVANGIAKYARQMGIRILTYWAFSTENWKRANREVSFLMGLFEQAIAVHLKEALKDQVRIIHIGRKDRINTRLKRKIVEAEEKTEHFNKYYLVIALDYGGRDEIVRAIKRIKNGELRMENFDKVLDTKDLPQPEPDLIIRTSAEKRTSGFMLWQAEYSEYMFIDKLFPDFTLDDFDNCIRNYLARARRFGA